MNEKSKGKLVWINNFDKSWTLKINNFPASINKFGPFIMVDTIKGVNNLFFEFNPPWGNIIRFIYLTYLFIPIVLLINFVYSRKYKLSPQ